MGVFGERGITEYFLSELVSGLYLERAGSVTDSERRGAKRDMHTIECTREVASWA